METNNFYLSTMMIEAPRTGRDFVPDGDLGKEPWSTISRTTFETSYTPAQHYPEARTQIAVSWSPAWLYIAFWSRYTGLNVYPDGESSGRKWELWMRDVVEVFINPFPEKPLRYFEFEVAPNNQWIDLAIDLNQTPIQDAAWSSGFLHSTRLDEESRLWVCEMGIPVSTMGVEEVREGMKWRINFYRCDGPGDDTERRFLAWSPTFEKNFHVPARFGEILFVGDGSA